LRRTWAPRGKTPVLATRFRNWQQVSMAGLLAYHPNGRARILFHTLLGAYNDEHLIAVVRQMRRQLRSKVTLIWDRLPAHRSRHMKAFLASQRHWLRVEELPPYAYDLNPCEALWSNVKGQELANLCPEEARDSINAANGAIERVRSDQELSFAFLRRSRLSFRPDRH
jgi:transposase